LTVWFDISDDHTPIPTNDGIFLKVTRVTVSSGDKYIPKVSVTERPVKIPSNQSKADVSPNIPVQPSVAVKPAPQPSNISDKLLQFDSNDDNHGPTVPGTYIQIHRINLSPYD
jgi:hypothetical protein